MMTISSNPTGRPMAGTGPRRSRVRDGDREVHDDVVVGGDDRLDLLTEARERQLSSYR